MLYYESKGCTVHHRSMCCSVMCVLYDDMSGEAEPRTVPSRPGWSEETSDLRRGRGDDGWAGCNGGGAQREPPGQNGPSPVLPNGRPPGLLMHPPQGEGRRGEGRRGRRDCGKWMHVGNSAFCHQTMGL